MTQGAPAPYKEDVLAQEDVDPEDILRILQKHNEELGGLIAILEEIQTQYSYLPEKALKTVADRTGRSLVDIYGVATFYRSFSLSPRGKHLISVCIGHDAVTYSPPLSNPLMRLSHAEESLWAYMTPTMPSVVSGPCHA